MNAWSVAYSGEGAKRVIPPLLALYICVKNGSDEEKSLKSLSAVAVGGVNSLCEGGLSFIYLYLRWGGGGKCPRGVKKIARASRASVDI